MKHFHHFFTLLIFSLATQAGFSQGCSDAGFCTMGAMKPDQKYAKNQQFKLRSVELGAYYGRTQFQNDIYATIVDINVGISEKNTLQFKVPYQFVHGRLADTQGFGDISVSYTRNVLKTEKYQFNATIGFKIPTNNSDKTSAAGLPLPMYYQTSLGTYDIVAGASLITKKWLFGIGYQQVIINNNNNQFLWGAWANSDKQSIAGEYPRSKGEERGTDIMLRIERNFRFSNFNFNVGLLPIYRLNQDSFVNAQGTRLKIAGSEGFAFSALAGGGYNFSVNTGIKIMAGYKILDGYSRNATENRGGNADGLSRDMVLTIGYEIRF
jgi:hypothetical protein